MRNDPSVLGLVVLVTSVLMPIACSCAGTSTSASPELEDFAVQAIIDEQLDQAAHGYQHPEGAIVAHVTSTEPLGGPLSPKRVWRYREGQLSGEDPEELEKALGDDRSEWPSFTFVFSFESATTRRATMHVHTYYDMGITASSRGGNAQKWELEKRSGAWVVTKKVPYMFWD